MYGGKAVIQEGRPGRIITREKPGKRAHWGLLAQQVKAVCDQFGVDFGGWIKTNPDDPDSEEGLRYDQFIAPLIRAVQQLGTEIQALKQKRGPEGRREVQNPVSSPVLGQAIIGRKP